MEQRKIVLIGKTGDGKSSTGNTILRKKAFTSKASANAVTAKSIRRQGLVDGRKITVIDTPGFFDPDREDEIKSDIIKTLVDCAPAVDAFIIVLKVGRYTRQENEVVQQFLNTMKGEHVLKHTVILFTHGEQLQGQTIQTFVKANSQLQELVDKCGGHCHVIDNIYWNGRDSADKSNIVKVKKLLDTIDKMVKENGRFTNELLQTIDEEIKEEMKKNEENLLPEEKREKAKGVVLEKFLRKVVGATTGVLIGALLGVGVSFAAVLLPFKAVCNLNALKKDMIEAAAEAAAKAAAEGAATAGGAVVTGGAAVTEEAAAVVGVGAGTKIAVGVIGLAGAVGGVTGWNAAEDADSVYDAMIKAAKTNYENATVVVEKVHEFAALVLKDKPK